MSEIRKLSTIIGQGVIGGVVATLAMTGIMLMAPMMGMPKMDVGQMLSSTMGTPYWSGWLMHFIIGVGFAISYCTIIRNHLSTNNDLIAGGIFGIIVLIVAQIMMLIARTMGVMPVPMGDSPMALRLMGSVVGHVAYGLVLGFFVKK